MRKTTMLIGLTIIVTWFTLFVADLVAAQLSRNIEGAGIFYWFVVAATLAIGTLLIILGSLLK